jgi:pimeloyl-ACP methyl ester carboxylesterase
MRKPFRKAFTIVGVAVAIPVLFLGTTSVVNLALTASEASSIKQYGQLVPVDGKHMNVVVAGDGQQTIVLLPGLGTAAPALDFEPLIEELQENYRVIALEPFGTGLSDPTDEERTAQNIASEVHEALQYLGVDRFVLMGHSIAGIYALTYSAAYPEDLEAFVGIDNSVPDQPRHDEQVPADVLVAARNLGLFRILAALEEDPYVGLPYDEETKNQMNLLSRKNAFAPTVANEMENAPGNFAAANGMTFPRQLPVLLFVRSNELDVAGWVELHTAQAASVDHGQVITLHGDHYLHHRLSEVIADETTSFLTRVG